MTGHRSPAPDFGIAAGAIGAEYFSLAAGTDLAPLFEGLDGDVCHFVHWGYVIAGDVVITYHDVEHGAVIDHIATTLGVG